MKMVNELKIREAQNLETEFGIVELIRVEKFRIRL